ncbi:MAG: hypothetical protein DRP42_04290 [Tenericutes bacterium]|nr:MAG: hypothetical protein DRP42_04290 [Mycoplasmatota bacterium]
MITKGKSNKFIFLSSFKQFFKNKTTSIIVVVFFGVTFGVVAGANSYSHRLANGVQEAAIDKTAFHAVASAKNIFNDESIVEPDD